MSGNREKTHNQESQRMIMRDNVEGGVKFACRPCDAKGGFRIPMEGLANAYQEVRCDACKGRGWLSEDEEARWTYEQAEASRESIEVK